MSLTFTVGSFVFVDLLVVGALHVFVVAFDFVQLIKHHLCTRHELTDQSAVFLQSLLVTLKKFLCEVGVVSRFRSQLAILVKTVQHL